VHIFAVKILIDFSAENITMLSIIAGIAGVFAAAGVCLCFYFARRGGILVLIMVLFFIHILLENGILKE
jgi:hypothetical protein